MITYAIKDINNGYYLKEKDNGYFNGFFTFVNLPYATFYTEFGAYDMVNFIKRNEWKIGNYNLKIVKVEIREVKDEV